MKILEKIPKIKMPRRKIQNCCVVEISPSFIKLAEVGEHKGKTKSINLFVENIASRSDEEISQIFKAGFNRSQMTAKKFLISLPRNQVIIRNITLPSEDSGEIKDMVSLHVAKQVPYSMEEIIYDFYVYGKDEMNYSKVMIAIVRRDVIKRITTILDLSDIIPEGVILSSEGIFDWLESRGMFEAYKNDRYFLSLDVDADFAELQIISKKGIIFTKAFSFDSGNLGTKEAKEGFIREIGHSLTIYQNEELHKMPSRIFISGAPASVEGLEIELFSKFAMPVVRIPVQEPRLKFMASPPQDISCSSVLGILLSPERKRLSFMPTEILIKKAFQQRSHHLIVMGFLMVTILMAVSSLFLGRLYNRSRQLVQIDEILSENQQLGQELRQKMKIVKFVRGFLDPDASCLVKLFELTKLVPDDITLTTISLERGKDISVRGYSGSVSTIFAFISELEKSDFFVKVQTNYTAKRKSSGADVVDFELMCTTKT